MTDNQIIYNLNASKPLKRHFHRLDTDKRRRVLVRLKELLFWTETEAGKVIQTVKREV